MSNALILLSILAIGIYGLLKLIASLRPSGLRHVFAIEFLERLKEYWESGGSDSEAYSWLIHRSHKMQGEMGSFGVVHNYKPPYQNYVITNYDIILNMIPDLRRCLEDDLLSRNLAHQYMNALQEAIVRYVGSIEDDRSDIINEIKNPVKWLRNGIRDIVAVPAYLLGWFGIISESTLQRWVSSLIFSVISGVVALAGFASAIVTIVIGWEQFVTVMGNVLP